LDRSLSSLIGRLNRGDQLDSSLNAQQVMHFCYSDVFPLTLLKDMNYLSLPVTQEMHDWCALLGKEMLHWPGVTMCHVFDTCAFYHRKVLFAILPDRRTLSSSTAISFRNGCKNQADQDEDWQTFELTNGDLVNSVLVALEKAYRDSKFRTFSQPPAFSASVSSAGSAHEAPKVLAV
jgi:hypothetical protein